MLKILYNFLSIAFFLKTPAPEEHLHFFIPAFHDRLHFCIDSKVAALKRHFHPRVASLLAEIKQPGLHLFNQRPVFRPHGEVYGFERVVLDIEELNRIPTEEPLSGSPTHHAEALILNALPGGRPEQVGRQVRIGFGGAVINQFVFAAAQNAIMERVIFGE